MLSQTYEKRGNLLHLFLFLIILNISFIFKKMNPIHEFTLQNDEFSSLNEWLKNFWQSEEVKETLAQILWFFRYTIESIEWLNPETNAVRFRVSRTIKKLRI